LRNLVKVSGIDPYTLPGAYGHFVFPFYYIKYIDQSVND